MKSTDTLIALNDSALNNDYPRMAEEGMKLVRIARAHTAEGFTDEGMPIQHTESIPLPIHMGLGRHAIEKNLPFGIMAFAGNGKTTFAKNLACYWLGYGLRVTVLANENKDARSDYIKDIFRIMVAEKKGMEISRDQCKEDPLKSEIEKWYASSRKMLNVFDVRPFRDGDLLKRITRLFSEDQTDIILLDYFQNTTAENGPKRFPAFDRMIESLNDISGTFNKPIGIVAQTGRKGNSKFGAPDSDSCEGCSRFEKDVGTLFTLKDPKANVRNREAFKDFLHVRVAKARFGPAVQLAVKINFNTRFMNGTLSEIEYADYIAAVREAKKNG